MKAEPARAPAAKAAAPPERTAAAPEASSPAPLSSLQRSLTGGSALPPTLRERMEVGFGSSFADVRVHTGGAAAAASARLQAEAFTSGRDIAFATGQYRPGTPAGDRLIAHELAHVVQQRHGGSGGAVQMRTNVSQASEAAETAADTAAATVLAGGRLRPSAGGLSLRGRIQRRARLGAPAPSPVLTLAPPRPGAAAPGAGPMLTPAMTASVSPAGGRLSGINRPAGPGAPEATATSPDTAQTAAPAVPATGRTPARVMVAGAPAGGAAPLPGGGETRRERQRQRSRDQRQQEELPVARGGGPGRRAGSAGGGGGGRFGRNLGDRGEAAAEAARQRLSARAQALETNEGADARIGAARAAAEPPANAAEADGQRSQTASLAAAEIPAPDSAAASHRAQASLQAAAPTTIEELDNFAGPGGAGSRAAIGNAIAAEADQQAGPVRQTMGAMGSAPPGAAPPPAVPQPEPLAAPASADPALAAATPPPVPGESLDATEFRDAADSALAEHDIDDATLERAEEGPLHAIGADKRELNEAVDTAADRARGQEAAAIGTAESALSGAETQAEGAMEGGREAAQTAVIAEQDATRSGEQTGEQTLADSITGIYSRAETSVSERLGSLQSDAVERFRSAQAERLEQFASGVRSDLDAFKRQRYSGARGLYYQARDWLLSINSVPAVQALYERHRSAYIAAIDQLLATIRTDIEATIADCRRTLAAARSEIDALVQSQRGSLDAEAQAALNRATAQFAAMESRIETTRRNALAALDAERTRAIAEMDRALEEIRAENAGLVDRIASAIAALAAALGEFMALLARVTRMGVGAFLSAALGQARDGVQNHLWDQLQEAFKQWIFMKLPVLQLLLNLPPNWLAMLTALSLSLIGLFTDSLPALLPAIGVAAMVWLATTLAAKLIPGVGAIMAVIDAIRGAWSLVQSLFSAAGAFLQFVMKVAEPAGGAGVAFAQALAHGIVGAVDAILTFLGVDRLIRRVVGAIARPFGRIVQRIQTRFRQWQQRRRQRRSQARDRDRRRDGGRENPADANRHRRAEDAARRDRRAELDRRRRDTERDSRRPERRRESDSDRRRREQQERDRRNRERLDRAVVAIRPRTQRMLRDGASERRFQMSLRLWQVRYRLSSLRMLGEGSLEAVVNPRTVFDRARRVPAAELGRLIRPLLARAEQEYRTARSPQAQQNVDTAHQRISQGGDFDPASGAPLTRGERAQVFGQAPVPPSSRGAPTTVNVGAGTTAEQRFRPQGITPQLPSQTVLNIPNIGGGTYPSIARALQVIQRPGVRGRDLLAILAAPRNAQAAMAANLGLSSAELQTLQGITALDDLERGRDPALGAANLVNRRLGAGGSGTIQEQFGDPRDASSPPRTRGRTPGETAGSTAPSTMTNAVAVRQTEAERRVQNDRIGRIFHRLEATALRATLVDNNAGSLENVARAVDRWLRSVRARNPDPLVLEQRKNELVAQLAALLASYD